MTTPLPASPTPYTTPALLTAAPTGVSWSTIPSASGSSPAAQLAEQSNICSRATAQADSICNQVLRATVDSEIFRGPGYRVTIRPNGTARVVLQRGPVLAITSVQVAPANQFPHQWTQLPAGYFEPEYPVIGLYDSVAPSAGGEGGQAIIIAPGFIDWACGRGGWIIQVTYINGWPHAGTVAPAAAGDTVLQVDDCTGWAVTSPFSGYTGATGTAYDSGQQEIIHVASASVPAGPGTLTLASPLLYAHSPGVMVSTLPASVTWAVILLGTAQALTRGATSTTVHVIPGGSQPSDAGKGPAGLIAKAECLLAPFRRII